MRVVIDTNILVAATRSRTGASRKLLALLPSDKFQPAMSVTHYLEYLDVMTRKENIPVGLTDKDMIGFVREILSYSHKQGIYFTWRPSLKDADDDFVLELAIASQSEYIITFNEKDFRNIELFGIEVISPSLFLKYLNLL